MKREHCGHGWDDEKSLVVHICARLAGHVGPHQCGCGAQQSNVGKVR